VGVVIVGSQKMASAPDVSCEYFPGYYSSSEGMRDLFISFADILLFSARYFWAMWLPS